ncbi:MAG: protein kinase [Steroidobacteraceae bacterium]|nr:protein kinase [Steroidobacteraceae bacterium]
MTEAVIANSGGMLSSRYTLLEKLGTGGQAEVWRARDETAGIEVALKILSPAHAHDEGAWAALVREHAIASKLDHPAILKVYPPHREGDFVALPMELASGGDLRRLRGKSYLDVVPVLIDIAQGLEYAHEHGVIHRDLKPGNILFDARGRVRIADFGIAGVPGEVPPAGTRPGLSPFTASPEQLRGEPPAISDDIYGLGALAYELLSGYPPYYPRFEVKRVLEEPVPDLKPAHIMPRQLVSTVMRMLSKRAAHRPRTMREVIDELDAALNDTLAFEFEPVDEPDGPTAAMKRDAAVIAAAEAARRGSASPGASAGPGVPASRDPGAPAPAPRLEAPGVPYGSNTVRPVAYAPTFDASEKQSRPAIARSVENPRSRPGKPASAGISPPPATYGATYGLDSPTIPGFQPEESAPAVMDMAPPPSDPPILAERRGENGSVLAAAAEAVREEAPHLVAARAVPTYWDQARLRAQPSMQYLRTRGQRRRSWPWVVLSALVAGAAVVFVVLPKYGVPNLPFDTEALRARVLDSLPRPAAPTEAPAEKGSESTAAKVKAAGEKPAAMASANVPAPRAGSAEPEDAKARAEREERLKQARATYQQRLDALEARGAGVWGGADFATAKTRAAESVGAHDAGSIELAEQRLNEALRLLGVVESRASQTLANQLAAGERALAAGQAEVARQAFESARRIDPDNARAREGLQRVRNLGGVLPLLADAENAEAEKDWSRAVQDYSQALSLDPGNTRARAGLNRANAALGEDTYAKAVGAGFAALGVGRLEEAREAFEKARRIRPNGEEARNGLSQVNAALRARGFASARQRAVALEAEERWADAVKAYDEALKIDPSLVFAQQGRARAQARADLAERLQSLIDRPERLASEAVRAEAQDLLRRASEQQPSGPVLRSQIARLEILLPTYDMPVRLELVSDNATQVQIQRVGTFGTFSRREITLKPGKYTVVGTRPGFRDVRRDVTIAPGSEVQTISVSCVEPI